MNELVTFKQYYELGNMLIEKASKEQLAECARLLALNLAHYQGKFGDLPMEEMLLLLDANEPGDAQAKRLIDGMQNLVGVLANVCGGLCEVKH